MSRVTGVNSTDTVSSIYEESVSEFDYKYFCKSILKETKRKMDAGFLAPIKLYQAEEEARREEFLAELGGWMDAYVEKNAEICHFWVYMTYDGGYQRVKRRAAGQPLAESISDKAVSNAQTYMNDVSKLEKANYIRRLCENRDDAECWILRAYEITLRKMYEVSSISTKMQAITAYLKKCNIRAEVPLITNQEQNEEQIFQSAANLFLLAMRLRLGIEPQQAAEWYRSGNVAYFRYRDRMLEEYTRLNALYFSQSYERFLRMKELAMRDKNKYAAKEAGDILRLGAELQDSRGNRVSIGQDREEACEYYRICIDAGYIPAYVPAVKTGALIDERQREALLGTALAERDPEGVACYVERQLERADSLLRTDQEKSARALTDAAEKLLLLEDADGEKHALRAALLATEAFHERKRFATGERAELDRRLRELYERDVADMEEAAVLAEAEAAYLRARGCGFYEAEYRLGMLLQRADREKSERYFKQGADKGCRWCRLEYAKLQRQEPWKWLRGMAEAGRYMQGDSALQDALALCWIDGGEILATAAEGELELEPAELMEIYLQIDMLFTNRYNPKADGADAKEAVTVYAGLMERQKKKETITVCAGLMERQKKIEGMLKRAMSDAPPQSK